MSMEQVLLDSTHTLTDTEREAIRHALWFFGDQRTGFQPGTFTQHLLNAFGSADAQNLRRLSSVFPQLGAAVFIVKNFENGAEMLAGRLARSGPVAQYKPVGAGR
jgi:hypothetical protein